MGQMSVQALNDLIAPKTMPIHPRKRRPAPDSSFLWDFFGVLLKFWNGISKLLKSAIIYPCVAIPVHFR
jgi:hypothetical protein